MAGVFIGLLVKYFDPGRSDKISIFKKRNNDDDPAKQLRYPGVGLDEWHVDKLVAELVTWIGFFWTNLKYSFLLIKNTNMWINFEVQARKN